MLLAVLCVCAAVSLIIYVEEIVFIVRQFKSDEDRTMRLIWILAFFPVQSPPSFLLSLERCRFCDMLTLFHRNIRLTFSCNATKALEDLLSRFLLLLSLLLLLRLVLLLLLFFPPLPSPSPLLLILLLISSYSSFPIPSSSTYFTISSFPSPPCYPLLFSFSFFAFSFSPLTCYSSPPSLSSSPLPPTLLLLFLLLLPLMFPILILPFFIVLLFVFVFLLHFQLYLSFIFLLTHRSISFK